MPAGITQTIDRQVDSRLNAGTGDILPGQSVASGTGAAQYQGIVGMRQAQDPSTVRFQSSVGTLFGGIYQYVFMTYTTTQPARGQLVFWDLSVAEALYQVNGDAKPTAAIPTLIAGVVLNTTVVKNTYAWMQIAGRASCLYDSTITSAAAGNGVTAKISATVPSTVDVGTALAATTAGAVAGVDTLIGIAETLPVLSVISVVQLNNTLMSRRI
jgi:hypothetical protein